MEILMEVRKAYRQTGRPIWKAVYELIDVAKRKGRKVNVAKLERLVPEGAYVVVPGKVLGGGIITKSVMVGALDFSSSAVEKIKKANGKAIYLDRFIKRYGRKEGLILVGG